MSDEEIVRRLNVIIVLLFVVVLLLVPVPDLSPGVLTGAVYAVSLLAIAYGFARLTV